MFDQTDDLRVDALRPLIPPAILLEEIPLTSRAARTVRHSRANAEAIIDGRDDRLLVVVGPCSIHDTAAALEYGGRIGDIAKTLSADLHIVMRVYFEKPRTTVGWKGLINDPQLDGSFAINDGLRKARRLLADLAEMEVPAGCELLDTITPQFITDLVSWGAIGARTAESQVHRQLASGLSMPVGFKNGTDGNLKVASDAILAVEAPHHFMGVSKQGIAAIVATTGNPTCHAILRGGSRTGPNFMPDAVTAALDQLGRAGIQRGVMVDLSHGNSNKDHRNQPAVGRVVADQIAAGQSGIMGVMIESHLLAGKQPLEQPDALQYGVSVTDACIGWETTKNLLHQLAAAVKKRREAS